jgi:hypothetical protein
LNTGIELARNEVYGASDSNNVKNDVRIGLSKCRELRQQNHHGSRPGHYNSKAPRRSVPNASGLVDGTSNLLKCRRQVFQKSCPGSGWCDAFGRPSEKLQLKSLFKPPDRVAQCRLRHTQLYGGPCKASFTGDNCKRSEFVQFVSHDL